MSSKQAGPSLIQVPHLFSIVEPGVYRCQSPTAAQVPFLAQLNLRTIISLTPEHPIKALLAFSRASNIDFIHLGVTLWKPITDWKPIRDETVKAALEILLDVRNHPILIVDPLGIHQTGCVVGALRVLQGWNFASNLIEYRAHSGPTKHRYSDEQYIELFDPDLVNLPAPENLPAWFQPLTAEDELEEDELEVDGAVIMQPTVNGTISHSHEANGAGDLSQRDGFGQVDGQDRPPTGIVGVG